MRKQGKETGINSPKRIRRLALIAVVVAVFALGATAAISLRTSQAKNSTVQRNVELSKDNSHSNLTPRSAVQQLPVDAQTGQIRPLTKEEAQELAQGIKQLVNQSTDGLKSVRHPDGSVSMDLQGRFQNIAVAKRNADGRVSESCVDNPESAAAFFGIDPKLVGVQKDPAPQTTNSPAQLKGRDQ